MTDDHKYYFNGQGPVPSVTTVTDALQKWDLMAWKQREAARAMLHLSRGLEEPYIEDDLIKEAIKETKAVRVSGTVFQFTSVEAGQPFYVRDGDGNLILRDRGSIRQVIEFDTLGDATPGGVFITDVSFRANGPHPGFEFDSCSIFG